MGKIVYLVGATVDARQHLLERKMAAYPHSSFLHLVPTRGRVIELEKDPQFWPRRKVETLTRIIHQIFEEHVRFERFGGFRPIDDPLKFFLIRKIIEKRGTQGDGLTYFSALLSRPNQDLDFPGICRSIAHFFSILVRNNFQDRFAGHLAERIIRLEEETPGSGEQRYAIQSDLTWLFGDFEEIKREVKGYDGDDILSSVRAYLREGGIPQKLAHADILILDGFIHFSRIEEDILFDFFPQVREVWWLLDYDGDSKDPIGDFEEAAGSEATWHWEQLGRPSHEKLGRYEAYRIFAPFVSLIHRVEGAGIERNVERAPEASLPRRVAWGLYSHGDMDRALNGGLRIRSFSSKVDEVRGIAGEIKRIIHEDNLDPSSELGKIRIIFPDLNGYSTLLAEVFTEFKLPYSLTKGLPLCAHPIANIFKSIFAIPLNHFKREDIFRLYASGLNRPVSWGDLSAQQRSSQIKEEYLIAKGDLSQVEKLINRAHGEGGEMKLDIFLIDGVARKCGLNHLGPSFSEMGGSGLLQVRDYYLDRLQRAKGARDREDLTSEYYRFLVQVDLLAKQMTAFHGLATQQGPEGIVQSFFQVIDSLGLPEQILSLWQEVPDVEPEVVRTMLKRDVKAYRTLKDVVQASANELRITGEVFGSLDGYPLLSQFYAVFKQRLNNAYIVDEPNPNVIRISQWLEIRGRSFDYVFAGGLTTDKFPLREEANFILPEVPHRLFRMRDRVDESKHLFSHVLRNARRRLYLSYPQYIDEKEVQSSSVIMDLDSKVRSRLPSEVEGGGLEERFKWEDNPYFTSEEEFLNAARTCNKGIETTGDAFFPLKRIIVKNGSPPEHLLRGINLLRSRWAADGLFEHDGVVRGSARFNEFLVQRSDVFSPSQLETLANCPMRYLFEHIYGLRGLEELGVEVTARDLGEHLHGILRAFFERLKNEQKNVAELGLKRAFSWAMEVVDKYLKEHPLLSKLAFFAFQKRDFLAGLDPRGAGSSARWKEREGIFAKLLRFEEMQFRDRMPAGVEYPFGQEGMAPVVLGRTKIQGYIDRFDTMKENGQEVYIYDYKTGRMPSSEMVKKGLSFQLPAYMLALRKDLQLEKISAAFYALKREAFLKDSPLKHRIKDHWEDAPGLDISGVRLLDEYAQHLMGILENGYFHHSTDEMICPHCDFRYACYKDMRRMEHLVHEGAGHGIYSGEKNLEKWREVDQFRDKWKAIGRSVQKALSLKTSAGRRRHFDSVMDYRDWLREHADSLPFYSDYVKELLDKIDEFEGKWSELG